MKTRLKKQPSRPRELWWHRSEQVCDHCLQAHAVGLEVRCASCDEPVCGDCAVVLVAERVTVCPACESAGRRRH